MSTLSDNGKQNNENIQLLGEHPTDESLPGKIKSLFKYIQNKFSWISAAVVIFATFLGLLNLWFLPVLL